MTDFTWIANLTGDTFGVVAKADGPFRTWADVVKFAEENPVKLTYASPGAGTSLHLGTEQIAARDGLSIRQVPMKGAGEFSAALLGGHVMLQADATNWKALVDSGELRALMVWRHSGGIAAGAECVLLTLMHGPAAVRKRVGASWC